MRSLLDFVCATFLPDKGVIATNEGDATRLDYANAITRIMYF